MITDVALVEIDQPAIAAERPAEADVATIPVPGAVIAVDGDQGVALATVEPSQTIAAVKGAQLLDVAMVEDDPAMTAVGAPSNVMVVVNFSEGAGDMVYNGQSPTTITVGGLAAGSPIAGQTFTEILETMLTPFQAPSFSVFSIAQTSPVEVGATVSGNKSFSYAFAQSANVAPDSVSIVDVTNSTTLASGLGVGASPASANVGSIQKTSPASHQWRATATNIQSATFNSSNATVAWLWKLYHGTSGNPILIEDDIEALSNSELASSRNAIYSFAPGDYKYFAWADSLGSPTASTGFRDTATNFPVAMADSTDDAAFSNTQNGWSYALVNVTNVHGVAADYRVYRTKNILGGSINIQVS